jgi:hypothetical protein
MKIQKDQLNWFHKELLNLAEVKGTILFLKAAKSTRTLQNDVFQKYATKLELELELNW